MAAALPQFRDEGPVPAEGAVPAEIRELQAEMRKVEAAARRVQELLQGEHTCEELLALLSGMRADIHKVGLELLSSNLLRCRAEAGDEADEADDAIREAKRMFLKFT